MGREWDGIGRLEGKTKGYGKNAESIRPLGHLLDRSSMVACLPHGESHGRFGYAPGVGFVHFVIKGMIGCPAGPEQMRTEQMNS